MASIHLSSQLSYTHLLRSSTALQSELRRLPARASNRSLSKLTVSSSSVRKTNPPFLLHNLSRRNGPVIAAYEDAIVSTPCEQNGDGVAQVMVKNTTPMWDIIYRLIGPNIFWGTLIGFIGAVARTWITNPQLVMSSNWILIVRTLAALSVSIGIDTFVGPVNQISDANIDKINYPNRPIISGKISVQSAWSLAIGSVIHCIATSIFLDAKWLLPVVVVDLLLGAMYSIRPFYLKKRITGALFTCALMRGFVLVFLQCSGASSTLGIPFQLNPSVIFLAAFSTIYGLAFGILKDLPDLEGDTKCNVRTLASILGARQVTILGGGLLFVAYAASIAVGVLRPQVPNLWDHVSNDVMFRQSVMITGHFVLACCLVFQLWKLNNANYTKVASKSFYLTLWKLLNAEYLLFPFI